MNAITPITPVVAVEIDPKLAWLARASARFQLVEAGAMDLDEAYDGLVADQPCPCVYETVRRWERLFPPSPIKRRKTFR